MRRPPRRNTGLIAGLSAGAAVLVAGIIAIVALAGQRGEPSGSSGAGAAPSATAGIASLVATLTAPDGALMRNAFFSADGKYLAAASTAADVYVWNAGTHQRIATVSVGTGDQADPVGFSADDQTLYVIDSAGKQLYDFDVATGKAANVYTLPSGSMWGDTWDSGVLVAYTSGGAVGIYDMATGKLDAQLKNPGNSPVAAVRPDGDGKYVVISDEDGEAYLVASSGTVAGTFGYTYSATGASYPGISLKGKTVYVPGGPKGAAKLWDRTTGAYVTPAGRQWPKLDNGITFSNDSRFVITSPDLSSDVVDTWGIATRAHVATVTVPGSANQELLSVAPGAGEILATGSLDASAGTFSELSIWQIP